MTAYNLASLYNQSVQEESSEAFQTGFISEESYKKILLSHPGTIYTPNYFIKIALGILTGVAVLFAAILMGLLFATGDSSQVIALCIFLGIACYASLELFIKKKNFYNAGVDNVLMASSIIFIIGAFFVNDLTTGYTLISGVSMLLCLYMCIRFTDAFMAIISYLSFFMFIFLLYIKLGGIAKATAPFLLLILSALVYFFMGNLIKRDKLIPYNFCMRSVMFLALVTFYASANYFVVTELSNQLFGLQSTIQDGIPFGWFFWIMTFVIPAGYIFYGITRKDLLFTRTGMGLSVAAVLTIRYYHAMLPIELVILIAGVILITASYCLIQSLK
ncbi:MAG: hypothetical protein ABIO76_05270, partial [Ginsengibacter sp.]